MTNRSTKLDDQQGGLEKHNGGSKPVATKSLTNTKHYKSVFDNEQDLLKALIELHLHKDIELDPMFFKGNFYKNGVKEPSFKSDMVPQMLGVAQEDARSLPFESNIFNNMILDPPFMFGIHGKSANFYSSRTHGIMSWEDLQTLYQDILKEAYRLLKPKGILIFKCQDYTDNKTTMTHALVYNWATELGFYAKDLAILVKPNKVYNGNTTQRHLRKIHTYFWVFEWKLKEPTGNTQTDERPPLPDLTNYLQIPNFHKDKP